jgi:hypothetical protein
MGHPIDISILILAEQEILEETAGNEEEECRRSYLNFQGK